MYKILVIDTETAALNGAVCDLGVLQIDEELEVVKSIESLIDPQRPMAPAAQAVHGITSAMVADAPTIAEYVEHYGNPFTVAEGEELILIGHRVAYDIGVLKDLLPEAYTPICTLRMARNQWPDLKKDEENHQLGTLAVMFDLERGPAHRAMGDTVTCLSLLRHIADVSEVSSFEELLELGKRPLTLESRISFGKHQGMRLKELPLDYVRWICNQADMDIDLKTALNVRLQNPVRPSARG